MTLIYRLLTTLFLVLLASRISPAQAQTNTNISQDTYFRAKVIEIVEEGVRTNNEFELPYQIVRVKLLEGNLKDREITIDHGSVFTIEKSKFVKAGDTVVVNQIIGADASLAYHIIDIYRLNIFWPFLLLFAVGVIALSGWRGAGSIIGMIVSLFVIAGFIVPNILSGRDALTISIIGCMGIMMVTIYLAHGFSKKTTIALISTFLTLVITGILSVLFVKISHLTGLGTEDAYALKLGPAANINFRGLLLGGILIGALGVLDDVTTGLTASVFEIQKANTRISFTELFRAGLRVGREHITSLVNTLVLAYAGASLPLFIILVTNPNHYPLWSILNSEMIVEEIVRTLAGSFGLIVAVPLTTLLASYHLTQKQKNS